MQNNIICGLLLFGVIAANSACNNSNETRIEEAVKAHAEAKKEASEKNAQRFKQLSKAAWLLGSWKGVLGKGISVENWYKQDDSTFAGDGMFIKGSVTLSEEHLQLTQKGNDVYYIPTVKNQNGNKPVPFKMTRLTDREMVFENPAHDFPKKIKYTRYGADSLVAEISGPVKGQQHTEQFPMKRAQ